MLHPSYSDLMKVVNSEVEPGEAPVVNSRYSIVMATSKRARQIIGGDEPMVKAAGKKPLSVAIDELNQSKIKILSEEEAEIQRKQMEEMELRMAKAAAGGYVQEQLNPQEGKEGLEAKELEDGYEETVRDAEEYDMDETDFHEDAEDMEDDAEDDWDKEEPEDAEMGE